MCEILNYPFCTVLLLPRRDRWIAHLSFIEYDRKDPCRWHDRILPFSARTRQRIWRSVRMPASCLRPANGTHFAKEWKLLNEWTWLFCDSRRVPRIGANLHTLQKKNEKRNRVHNSWLLSSYTKLHRKNVGSERPLLILSSATDESRK